MLVDTHCHLNLDPYDADRADVIERARAAGVTRIVIPAIDAETGESALRVAEQFDGVFVAVGYHPNDIGRLDLERIRAQAQQPRVVAIGEIGLDYHWNTFPRYQQIAGFEQQLALAAELELPVIIHNRSASDDVIPILEHWVTKLPDTLRARPGVLHSVSAPPDLAARAVAAGFYLGFTGPITFKKAVETRDIVRVTPQERILVETDGPWLTPEPYRGKRNEPAYIPYICDTIARVREITPQQAAEITTENARRLFRLP